jgi:hypothetical protein
MRVVIKGSEFSPRDVSVLLEEGVDPGRALVLYPHGLTSIRNVTLVEADGKPLPQDQVAKKLGLTDNPDPKQLPKDVADEVTGTMELSPEQIDDVMRAIGESAVSALRRTGFQDAMVYPMVAKMQIACRGVIEKMGSKGE